MPWLSRNIVMSPPYYFRIEHEGNQRQRKDRQPNIKRALEQWFDVYDAFQEAGVCLSVIPAYPNCPELCFPGDSFFICEDKLVKSNFHKNVKNARQYEVEAVKAWFKANYILKEIAGFTNKDYFEGQAEALFWGENIVFLGYGQRTNISVAAPLQKLFSRTFIPLQLKQPFFHLDLALFPLDEECVIFCPDAFERHSWLTLERIVLEPRTVSKKEAWERGGLNARRVGDCVVISLAACEIVDIIREKKYAVKQVDVSEFFDTAAGGVKCLTAVF